MKPQKPLIRIQKLISASGVASRREAERLLKAGKVSVNGHVVKELCVKVDPTKEVVKVGAKVIRPAQKGIILFYKPREVVCTMMDDKGRRCVADYLTARYRSYFPVGRLDWDATGLLILTNDGDLANRLMHPKYGVYRTYEAKVEGRPSPQALQKLERGVRLADGTGSAIARVIRYEDDHTWLEVIVGEGRHHFVKRLLQKIEHPVIKLKRVRYGPFRLGSLKPGQMRKLTETEYQKFLIKVGEYSFEKATKVSQAE